MSDERMCVGIWCPGAPEGPLLELHKSPYCFRGDHYLIYDDHTKELVLRSWPSLNSKD
jgi:hypothetical protein